MLPESTPQPGRPLSEGSWCLTLLAPSSLWWVDSRTWVSAGFRSGANSESGAFIGCLLSPCLTSPFPTGMSRDWLLGEILAPTGASSGECTTGTYLELSLLGLSLVSSATEAPLRCPSPCCFLRQQVSEIFLLPSSPSRYFWLPKPLSSGQYGTAGAAGVLAGNSMLKPGILRSTFKGVGRKLPEVPRRGRTPAQECGGIATLALKGKGRCLQEAVWTETPQELWTRFSEAASLRQIKAEEYVLKHNSLPPFSLLPVCPGYTAESQGA